MIMSQIAYVYPISKPCMDSSEIDLQLTETGELLS